MLVKGFVDGMLGLVDWNNLVVFGGVALAAVCFVALYLVRAAQYRRKLADLEAKLAGRVQQEAAVLSEMAVAAEGRSRDALREAQDVRHRVDEVEARIPNLYETLEQFRATLASIFQNELGAVLGSFDSSVTAVLEHMKADLHMGITRIETIEDMVQSRQKAGRALLDGGNAPMPMLGDASDAETGGASEAEAPETEEQVIAPDETAILPILGDIEDADDASQARRPHAA